MDSIIILKICFILFLTGNSAVSILTRDGQKEHKSDPRTEELEWIKFFAPGRQWDEELAKQRSDSVSNSFCPSGITGQFPYPLDCKRFINCWKGRGMIQVCAPGTLFNPATGECDYPDKVKCIRGEGYVLSPQPLITRFPVVRPPIASNQRFSRKEKENYKTDTITVHKPEFPPYFGHSYLTLTTSRPTSPTSAKFQKKVECPSGSAGLYPHPTDCTRFLNCWGGRMFIQKCGPGTYFNPAMSVCDHAGVIDCEHNEMDNEGHEVKNEGLQESLELELNLKKEYGEIKSTNVLSSTTEVLHHPQINLFDVRSGVEETIPEQIEKAPISKEKENLDGDENKERDPSWGKIINFGNTRFQSQEGTLFYDAQGNPVSSNKFWTGISYNNTSKIQQQSKDYQRPHNPSHEGQQLEFSQSQYNIRLSQQGSESKILENRQSIPGGAYYLRPHNHVINHYPPHWQSNSGLKATVHHNPQSYFPATRTQNDRSSSNSYYSSALNHAIGSGHFILVNDKVSNPRNDQHQTKLPATYLVPPRQDSAGPTAGLTETKTADAGNRFILEEPSGVLLTPGEGNLVNSQQPAVSGNDQGNSEYSGWKSFPNKGELIDKNSSKTLPKTPKNSINVENSNLRMQHNQHNQELYSESMPESSLQGKWNSSTQFINIIAPKDQIIPATTYRPISDYWPMYHGNKNPYRFTSRTFSAVTETYEGPPATKSFETNNTTDRVYVVYPIKNYETVETSKDSFKDQFPNRSRTDSESSQKVKVINPKKATEEDLKKRIKSEMDLSDSQEDVIMNMRDVEMYMPNLDTLFPNAGKDIRLKALSNHLDGYIEMKKPNGEWGLVCDKDYGWMISEANVVCKELGYGRGAQISWQGYPLDSSSESVLVSVSEVTCNGNEESLKDCHVIYGDNGCDITKNAVGLRCFDNVTTQCHPEEVEFNNSCYRVVKRDDFDDGGFTLEEAADYCNKIGGRISDVISQEENDFISQWLMEKHPDVRSVLTGGIGSAVMGRSLWMWFGSQVPMRYQNWWKGWAGEKKLKHGTIHEPSCVILRKSYPCFIQGEDETGIEVELGNVEPEFCSANYFYWDIEECKNLKELKIPHLCKKPLEEIGCVVGRGENYSGTASVSSSGLPCLPWDHPEVKEKLSHQITLQEWTSKLSGHNFCRNLGRQELHPWCFVQGKENSEYCSIPQCWNSVPGYSKSAFISSSCNDAQFECKPGECIQRTWFCDGKKDCSNGYDEAMCNIFLQEFMKMENKRMKGHGKEKWPEVNENSCAKLCLENKKFTCKSFSYDNIKKVCLLGETNVGLSGEVVDAKGWSYYELIVSSLNCSANKKFISCENGKCVNVTNICDGKDNCGDGSDEVNCDRIGYQIRLSGSNETNKGRVEVKILGRWGAVCDDKFNLQAGEVVCKELGFKYGVAEIFHNIHLSEENPIFLVDDLQCIGNETSIKECSFPGWGVHDCKPEEAVGVTCRKPETSCPEDQWNCKKSKECIPIRFLCDNVSDCDDGSDEDDTCNESIKLRLSDGPNSTAGRVEIRYLGTWGTICDDNFNDAAANVICRILGYSGPSYALKNAYFGQGKGPIWLDGIQCFGNETNVNECDHSGWGKHNCKHDEDASISCSNVTVKKISSVTKAIAMSSDDDLKLKSVAKLKQILFHECRDRNGSVESISFGTGQRERVVGSDVVREGIPWQASVRVRSPGGKSSHWCGAIIISPYHVLSAGHCLRDYSKPAYFVRVGDFDTELEDPEEQEFSIDHLYIHPEFNRKLHLNNDIALIKVKGEIHLGQHVRPACLAPSTDIYLPGTNCSISGWGSVAAHSSGYARTLRKAYVPILEQSLCKAPFVYGNSLSEGMFCAGKLDGGIDSCQGDSGGPIMCKYEGRQYLYGITSWGHGCGRANKPGVYTNVAYYSEWIQEKILLSLT